MFNPFRVFAIQKKTCLFFFMIALAITSISTAAASTPIYVGVNDISVTEDMSGQKLADFVGDCKQILEAFTFISGPEPISKEVLAARSEKDGSMLSKAIPANMVGKGLRIRSAQACTLQTKGYPEYLQQASKLASGWNFISVSKGMVGKSFNDISNTCNIEKVRLYAPAACKSSASEDVQACGGDYLIISPETKLSEYYRGKGVWANAQSDCELDENARPFIEGHKSNVAVSQDMVDKKIGDIKGSCDIETTWYYDASKTSLPENQRYSIIYTKSGEPSPPSAITADMVGKGFSIFLAEPGERCQLNMKGYTESFGAAARLVKGNNLIGVPKSMTAPAKSFNDVKGDCLIESAQVYNNKEGKDIYLGSESNLGPEYLGKAVWVKVINENGCTLNDEGKSAVPPKGDVAGSVDLVPELIVSPAENIKGGDTIQVALRVKNTGAKSTKDTAVSAKCAGTTNQNCWSFYNIVYFYKGTEYGLKVIPDLSATADLAFNEIKPSGDGSLEVIKQQVKIPEDFSGKIAIVAVVDSQQTFPEAEGGKDNNKLTVPLTVRAATLPNLVPTAVETIPVIEKFPTTIYTVKITVKNTGEKTAKADQFLQNDVSILKGSEEICKGDRRDLEEIQAGIKYNEQKDFYPTVKSVNRGPCELTDKDANYWAVVDVDTLKTSPEATKGAVAESNEDDNRQTFQIKGPQQCSPLGSRQVDKYCSIMAGTWVTQKDESQTCAHNFECKTELCIGKDNSNKKCVSEKQKTDILKLLGIG